jgi:hypothetical protein
VYFRREVFKHSSEGICTHARLELENAHNREENEAEMCVNVMIKLSHAFSAYTKIFFIAYYSTQKKNIEDEYECGDCFRELRMEHFSKIKKS